MVGVKLTLIRDLASSTCIKSICTTFNCSKVKGCSGSLILLIISKISCDVTPSLLLLVAFDSFASSSLGRSDKFVVGIVLELEEEDNKSSWMPTGCKKEANVRLEEVGKEEVVVEDVVEVDGSLDLNTVGFKFLPDIC